MQHFSVTEIQNTNSEVLNHAKKVMSLNVDPLPADYQELTGYPGYYYSVSLVMMGTVVAIPCVRQAT